MKQLGKKETVICFVQLENEFNTNSSETAVPSKILIKIAFERKQILDNLNRKFGLKNHLMPNAKKKRYSNIWKSLEA